MAPRLRGDYLFHASVEKAESGPTFLDFASPTPPFHVRTRVPTILRDYGVREPIAGGAMKIKSDPVGDALWTRPRSPRRSFSVASTASIPQAPRNLSSRTPTPAPSYMSTAPPSSQSATPGPSRVQPSASRPGTPPLSHTSGTLGQDGHLISVESGVTTRTLARIAKRSAQQTLASEASSVRTPTGVALPSSDPYVYERTRVECKITQEEKVAGKKGKGKGSPEPRETAWWHIKVQKNTLPPIALQPLAHPPDLTTHSMLRFGDLFYHRSTRGVQLWLWSESVNMLGEWVPVLLGIQRPLDDRVLSLTPNAKPSWIQKQWFRRSKNTVPVFILQ